MKFSSCRRKLQNDPTVASRPPKMKCYFFAAEVELLEAVGWVANRTWSWRGSTSEEHEKERIFVAAEALLLIDKSGIIYWSVCFWQNGEVHHGGSGCPCHCFGCHGQRKVRYEWPSFTSIHSLFLCVLLFWLKLMSHNHNPPWFSKPLIFVIIYAFSNGGLMLTVYLNVENCM